MALDVVSRAKISRAYELLEKALDELDDLLEENERLKIGEPYAPNRGRDRRMEVG